MVLLASLAAGCGGGGGGGSEASVGARELSVVAINVDGQDSVSLNTPLEIEFSEFVNPATIRPDTVQIRKGLNYGIQAVGEFKVSGNIVTFFPRLPASATLDDAGFQPGAPYKVTIEGYPKTDRVHAYTGRPLIRTFVGSFATAALTSASLFTAEVYKDPPPPKVVFSNPPDIMPKAPWTEPGGAVNVPTDAEIQLVLNRVPLSPSTLTTNNVSLRMVERVGYPQNRPIQGTPIVEQSFDSVILRFVPTFPLADQARYTLTLDSHITDLTGAYALVDNPNRTALRTAAEATGPTADVALKNFAIAHPEEVDPRTFLIFTTRDEPIKDLSLYLNFDGKDKDQNNGDGYDAINSTASFNDAIPGAVAAVFTAAGGVGNLVFPTASTTLSTNSPTLAINGVFNYKQITVPSGMTVTLTGALPVTLCSLKDATIAGVITSAGAKGADSLGTYSSAPVAVPLTINQGGAGAMGGANGGSTYSEGSGGTYNYTAPGGDGFTGGYSTNPAGSTPPGNGIGGGGGKGGIPPSAPPNYGLGGGGGGGGHNVAGSAGSNGTYGTSTWNGVGGAGGATGGIAPTSALTNDGKDINTKGIGGGGGGAGANYCYPAQGWRQPSGSGGGGGGAILIKSAGNIRVSGRIASLGGKGGDGTSSTYMAAGGGGGGGGCIALYANGNLDVSNSTLDTSGGLGGSALGYPGSAPGGKGGGGYIVLEDADGIITGISPSQTAVCLPDYYAPTPKFDPTGQATDAPSIFVSNWYPIGVIEPQLQDFSIKLGDGSSDFVEQNYSGCTIKYDIQFADEDPLNFGKADSSPATIAAPGLGSTNTDRASVWATFKDPVLGVQNVASTMNNHGYQFYRLRMTFSLKDGQKRTDPIPYVDRLRLRFRY